MSLPGRSTRRHFSDAARAAAIVARRNKREETPPIGSPEVFVIRLPSDPSRFGWEIRRFGLFVLDRGETGYATPAAAHLAGRQALPEATKDG